MELIMLRGLPGSGKTTWAHAYLVAHPTAVRVNRDELRAMLHGARPWSAADEAVTTRVRDALICQALLLGRTVISDDTNLEPYHLSTLTALAAPFGVTVRVVEMATPLEACIARDARRERPVGADMIRRMADRTKETQ